MKHFQRVLVLALFIVATVGLACAQTVHADIPHLFKLLAGSHRRVCDAGLFDESDCLAQVVDDKSGNPAAQTTPAGYGPAQIHGAYQLPTTSLNPGTIAIVDAYDDPNITSDLATYDSTYGLPVFPTCSKTVTTACFQKVNQKGTTSYPSRNSSWALETSLDVETAHQTCQNCKLILVEASSASYANLFAAVDQARILGATVISNSYGSSEFRGETAYDSHFNYPHIAFIFSSGDSGYGPTYPAASGLVTAVGGTTLAVSTTNTWQAESVWSGAGSGCSTMEAKPSFQTDSSCTKRTIADVSADADPNTGVAVYDTVAYQGARGWFQVGGTSLSAPIIAGAYGLANNVGPTAYANTLPYQNVNYGTSLHDILSGSNGSCHLYLCQGASGYDGPTGLGTPLGLGAF